MTESLLLLLLFLLSSCNMYCVIVVFVMVCINRVGQYLCGGWVEGQHAGAHGMVRCGQEDLDFLC